MIARAGGVEAAAVYLDKAKDYYGTTVMGSWHRFDDIDPDQPQTYVPFLFDCLGGASDKEHLDTGKPGSRETSISGSHITGSPETRDSVCAETPA